MKELIFDKLQRLWLVWSAYILLFLIFGVMSPTLSGTPGFRNWWLLFWSSWLVSLTTELTNGYGRVILTLPFTTRQIGRFLWLISVAMPTLLLAIFGGLGMLITASDAQNKMFSYWIQMIFAGGLLFGSYFWICSGAPLNPSEKWQKRFGMQTYGIVFALALAGGGYFLYKSNFDQEVKFGIFCLLGVIFTILGWFRAEGLVVDYSECRDNRDNAANKFNPKQNFQAPSGFGGISFLFTSSFIRLGLVSISILLVLAGYNLYQHHHLNWSDIADALPMSQIWFFLFVLGEITNLLPHLRFLRTLPLTSKQLAGVILALSILPFLICNGICATVIGLNQNLAAGVSFAKALFLGLAPVCVMTTAAIWHGEKRFERIVLTVIVLIISAIAPIYQLTTGISNSGTRDLPIYFVIAYPLSFAILAVFFIRYLLETNAMTYRIRAQDITGVNGLR